MKTPRLLLILLFALPCWAGTRNASRQEAEYYVAAYANHYGVPVEFVRALVEQESGWHSCAISRKGAAGLMQLMPPTARNLNVQDRCDAKQNVAGGVRHLARRFEVGCSRILRGRTRDRSPWASVCES
jgi:soluble lytic murein transglycosylase-like protein